MQLSDTIAALIRGWYVMAIGLLVTAVVGWTVYQMVPTKYEASGSLLLMPSEATVGVEGNPFLSLNGMVDARDVLLRRADSKDNRANVLDQVKDSDYTIGADPTTLSPIVAIQAQSRTPEAAISLLNAVLLTVDQHLNSMQNELGVPAHRKIKTRVLVADQSAAPNTKSQLRAAIATVAGGIVGTFILTGLLDGILTRRHQRMAQNALPESEQPEPTTSETTSHQTASDGAHPAPDPHSATVSSSREVEPRHAASLPDKKNGRSAPVDHVRLRVPDDSQ